MNGQMKNFDLAELSAKDKLVQDFIKSVNPYRSKPSLNIDLRSLAKYAKETQNKLSESEIQKFKLM
ncbi:MAG: hypothetical protein J5857_09480 [Treponema sp.]|nr:hypothetical protein [Treponema sp.]